MATQLQIAANRRNAQKCTGPKTPEGKARSALNALKHGLTARTLVVLPEDRKEFEEFAAGLRASLHPVGPAENLCADQIVSDAWLLHRSQRFEIHAIRGMESLLRNEVRVERSFYRALAELQRLQAGRPAGPGENKNLPKRNQFAATLPAPGCPHPATTAMPRS